MRSRTWLGILLLLLPAPARADWIAAAFLGHAATRPSTVVLTLPERQTAIDIEGVQYRGESFRSPQYYGYRVMWVPDALPWLGIEGEYIHAKVFAETQRTVHMRGTLDGAPIDTNVPMSSVAQRLAMSHGLNFLLANVAVRHDMGPVDPRGRPRLALVVRAGAGPTLPHAESTVNGRNVDQYESGGVGAQVGGSIEALAWKGLGVVADYKFTWATPEIDIPGGTARIPSRTHHVVFGIACRF